MARPKEFDQEQALIQAMDLFWRQGYEATSLSDLTRAMGISRQSLYDTYGDKHRLFLAALDRYCAMIETQLLGGLQAREAGLAAIQATVAGLIDFLLAFPQRRACLMANSAMEVAPHDKTVAAKVKAYMAAMEAAFAHALRNARAQGDLAKQADIPALARYLVGVANGMIVAAKSGADREMLEDIARVAAMALPIARRA